MPHERAAWECLLICPARRGQREGASGFREPATSWSDRRMQNQRDDPAAGLAGLHHLFGGNAPEDAVLVKLVVARKHLQAAHPTTTGARRQK